MAKQAPTDLGRFARRAVELGAKEAKLVPASQVFTAAWVRLKCRYGCGAYASSRNCPPHSPTPEQTRQVLDEYETAILVHGDRTVDIRDVVCTLEREVFLAGHHKALGYACGPAATTSRTTTASSWSSSARVKKK